LKQKSHWCLVLACGLILAVEAPLVISSLAADMEGAYPAWDSAEALPIPEPAEELNRLSEVLERRVELVGESALAPRFFLEQPSGPSFDFGAAPKLLLTLGH